MIISTTVDRSLTDVYIRGLSVSAWVWFYWTVWLLASTSRARTKFALPCAAEFFWSSTISFLSSLPWKCWWKWQRWESSARRRTLPRPGTDWICSSSLPGSLRSFYLKKNFVDTERSETWSERLSDMLTMVYAKHSDSSNRYRQFVSLLGRLQANSNNVSRDRPILRLSFYRSVSTLKG